MQKNILAIVLLGTMFTAVNVSAVFLDMPIYIRVKLTDPSGKSFVRQYAINGLNVAFDADNTISVGSLKRQIAVYIKNLWPDVSCCFESYLQVRGKDYRDNGYRFFMGDIFGWSDCVYWGTGSLK